MGLGFDDVVRGDKIIPAALGLFATKLARNPFCTWGP